MKNFSRRSSLRLIVSLILVIASCTDTEIQPVKNVPAPANTSSNGASFRTAGSFFEDFESGSKTSYTAANVTLASGSWYLSDALIGTSTSDQKTGTKSVRVRNTGTWELWMSANGGSSYSKVGMTTTTSSSTLSVSSFTVNVNGTVRFEIRKVSGGTNRINIDEFEVLPYGSSSSTPDNDNLAFGNPSGATTNVTSSANNYLIVKTYYTLSYNRSRATPNWVSWYVGTSSLGSAARQDDFRADTSLPSGWYQVQSTSYSGSGFDRGDNCPSADRIYS